MNILFIGNSHTYYNELQEMFAEMMKAGGCNTVYAVRCTGPGVSLGWHWESALSHAMIKERSWDFVVLQDRSGAPLEEPAESERHTTLLHDEIKKVCCAKVVLYMTWANRLHFDQQELVTEHYLKLQAKLGCLMAPVGVAWQSAFAEISDLRLHDEDNRHANPAGTYLAACVFYALIAGRSPVGLPSKIVSKGQILADLPENLAAELQKVAYETVKDKNDPHKSRNNQ